MRTDIVNMMRKMSGTDLGKLLLKDVIAGLGGGTRAYSLADFDAVVHGLDWRNRREYLKYSDLVSHISSRMLYGWWLCSVIEKTTLKFDVMWWMMKFCKTYEIASRGLTCQRLSYGTSCGEWRDPDEEEILLRDRSKQLRESFLENREGIGELHNTLITFVKHYLTFDKIMRSLAEMIDMPEIASIVKSPLHHVEELKQQIEKELATLPENSPYRELLPDIDISSLEPDMAEIESYISDTAELLRA